MNFTISEADANAILQYLITQPYQDVWQFVNILRNMQESPLKVDPETKEKYIDMGGGARMSFGAPDATLTSERRDEPEAAPIEPGVAAATPEETQTD